MIHVSCKQWIHKLNSMGHVGLFVKTTCRLQNWTLSGASVVDVLKINLSHVHVKVVKWLLQAGFYAKVYHTEWQQRTPGSDEV